jgi:hypothetical protein
LGAAGELRARASRAASQIERGGCGAALPVSTRPNPTYFPASGDTPQINPNASSQIPERPEIPTGMSPFGQIWPKASARLKLWPKS